MSEIESHLVETRVFEPSETFKASANIDLETYRTMYRESLVDPRSFWRKITDELHWFKDWDRLLEWNSPDAKWFLGGKTNISYNILERNVERHPDKTAIIFEGEPGDVQTFSYNELLAHVSSFAGVLKGLGVEKGDRVTIYMPMIPEATFAMLACARIGAVHSVVFGGFSAAALADRINDAGSKVVVTADGGNRAGKVIPLKANTDEAMHDTPNVEKVLVVKRTNNQVDMLEGRDVWYHDAVLNAAKAEAEQMDSEDPLFILYTSGSTGKPKGVLHTTAGYMAGTYITSKFVFDLKDSDVFFCTADVGWITGHSYIVYGPLLNGATVLMYEGAPSYPAPDRLWEIIEKHSVTTLYTAPTAIRAFMKAGDELPDKHPMPSLRLLGSVGEPINPEAWLWYHEKIGKGRCPIVDTWWQTETGSIMLTTLPGAMEMKPGSAGRPLFGVEPDIVGADGHSVNHADEGGLLIIKRPWPSMLRGVWGDPARFKRTYFGQFEGQYLTGDGARRDKDGYHMIMGRVDDVLNVSGHRLGTMEIESALVSHPSVAESAVVGKPDEVKGEGIVAFVTLKTGLSGSEDLIKELKIHVTKAIGAIARPDEIRFTDSLPKTRSGKIMRRFLRQIAAGQTEIEGDTSTLEDKTVIDRLRG